MRLAVHEQLQPVPARARGLGSLRLHAGPVAALCRAPNCGDATSESEAAHQPRPPGGESDCLVERRSQCRDVRAHPHTAPGEISEDADGDGAAAEALRSAGHASRLRGGQRRGRWRDGRGMGATAAAVAPMTWRGKLSLHVGLEMWGWSTP